MLAFLTSYHGRAVISVNSMHLRFEVVSDQELTTYDTDRLIQF